MQRACDVKDKGLGYKKLASRFSVLRAITLCLSRLWVKDLSDFTTAAQSINRGRQRPMSNTPCTSIHVQSNEIISVISM